MFMIEYIYLTILILFFFLITGLISYLMVSIFIIAPFVPTKNTKVDIMLIEGDISSTDIVVDLGSGDGRIILGAGQLGVKKAIGYEINPFLNLFAKTCAYFL